MLRTIDRHKNDRGYILLVVVAMMLAMAVMAFGMNRRAGMQARMSANQIRSSQVHLGQIAALEQAAWKLKLDPTWRTTSSGKDYPFEGITYNRKVQDVSLAGYTNTVTITVTAPGGLKQLTKSFRIIPPTVISALIADTENHRIRKVDLETGLITTFAGNGSSGFSGDGGPATDASVKKPRGLWAGELGIVYIADTDNDCIRKVDAAGTITTVAGIGGSHDFSGDLGQATSAKLDKPRGVAADYAGNIYIADTNNHVIRKVDATTGIIDTVAGIGKQSGDTGDLGPATAAKLDKPRGVWVDSLENIYIADTENHVIRKVDATTGKIDTVVGIRKQSGYSGDGGPATLAKLKKPEAVWVDAAENIYIADTENHVIRKVDATTGKISTVAGNGSAGYSGDGGPATAATMDKPRSVWVDEDGGILIADTENNRIRRVRPTSGNISTGAGNGSAGYSGDDGLAINASLKKPHAVCLHESPSPAYLFIADPSNYQIRKVDLSSGFLVKAAGTIWSGYNGDNIAATSARLNYPFGVHVEAHGDVYIADTYNHRIRKVNRTSGIITTVAGTGSKGFSGDGGPATNAKLRYPFSFYLDTYGNIFIVDTYNHRIRKVDAATGIISTVVGDGHHRFRGDGGPATAASLDLPFDAAVDNDGNLYICDTSNQVIRKVDASTGIIDTVAGQGKSAGYSGDGGLATNAKLRTPLGVFVDSEGNLYIADGDNDVIRKVDATTQIISTIAGDGTAGFSGDGGPATSAQLDYPEGIWVDRQGNLFLVDTNNCRIRRVDATTQIIDTIAGTTFCGYNGNNLMATDAALYYPSELSVYEPTGLERLPEVYKP